MHAVWVGVDVIGAAALVYAVWSTVAARRAKRAR